MRRTTNGRPLVIDEVGRELIRRLIAYADTHRVTRAHLIRMMELEEPPVGDDERFTLVVPDGYRCVFSIEEQPVGWCRHLAVSQRQGVPSLEAVAALAAHFGFRSQLIGERGALDKMCIWFEKPRAVNVVEPL